MSLSSVRILIRFFYLLLISCAAVITLLIVFLSQLELDDYRQSLEQQLSSALNQPVVIGHSSLTYNHGLALELDQLKVGPDQAPLAIIPRLVATLEIPPLFERKFILEQVRIDNPQLQFSFPRVEKLAKGTSHRLFNSLGISILTVHNAHVKIFQRDGDKSLERLEISNLHAVLRGWQQDQSGHLVVSGQLPRYKANMLLETKLPASIDPQIWRQEEHETELTITGFSTAEIPQLKGQNYPAALDLVVTIQGAPASGTKFNARLTGSKSREKIFSLTGQWTSSPEQDAVTNISGELLKIPLTGEFSYLRQAEKNYLAGRVGVKNIQLDPQILKAWRIPQADKLLKGELERLAIVVEKSWAPEQTFTGLPRIAAEVTLSNLNWDIPELKQFQDFSVDLSFEDKNLHIQDGVLVAGGHAFEFSGQIFSLLFEPKIDLAVHFNPRIDNFKNEFKTLEHWTLKGNIPATLKLSGQLLKPEFHLNADLSLTEFQLSNIFHKRPLDQVALNVYGQLSSQRIGIDRFDLQLDDQVLSAAGFLEKSRDDWNYSFITNRIALDQLIPFSPVLKKFRLQGGINISFERNQDGIHGVLGLDNVGGHLTNILSDLKHTTGEIQLDRNGFKFQALKASLGESAFLIDGLLSDWQNPQLSLAINGTDIRAQDLIFPNRQLTFHDLQGQLEINASGLKFSPVKVRLEQNTVATVFGEVADFSDPQVSLDIQADTVDVLDVIQLFHGSKTIKQMQQKRPHKPLRIKAAAKQGSLGGLNFTNAEGLIKDHNGIFTIFPLHFQDGEGWCESRVEFNRNEESAPLRVSGHVEGINASALHQDMFADQGLINGTLRGDFYIEGDPGTKIFWQEAKGGVHFQVSDGTLRKFRGLAQVFSLLNVSQIFAGKLPDMDKEGMPFSLMEASIQIADGQLKTEDLRVTSEAMNLSLIGTQGLVDKKLDFIMGVMPLRTVDKVITSIPIAGWVLAGEDKALLTAQFKIEGTTADPKVIPVPIDSVSKTVFGIFKRTLGLPGKLMKDVGSLFKGEPEKKTEP